MKSRQNPFQPASRVGKAHYHPSCNQSLSKKEKKTILSPACSNHQSGPELHSLSPKSHQLFERRDHRFSATDGQPVFAECWVSTGCRSSPANTTTSSDMETFKQPARAEKAKVSSELGVQQDSVLAKYIERFRHGRPQSREERQQTNSAVGEEQQPFWWMSSSLPLSSTPAKTTDKDVFKPLKDDHEPTKFSPAGPCQHDRFFSPCRRSLSILSETSQGEFDDSEILRLQERADRLLLGDECTLSDGYIHVSSEGLGGSDFSSPVSVDEPLRTPFIPSILKSTTVKTSSDSVQAASSQKSSVIPSLAPPTRPEEDILFQWRLRRKIEQAREGPPSLQHSGFHGPSFSWQAPILSCPSVSGQPYKQQQSTQPPEFPQKATHPELCAPQPETKEARASCLPASGPPPFPAFVVSDSSVFHPQTIAHVPAHMHFLCDVLPCPLQSSHASRQQNISKTIDESHTKVVSEKTQVPGLSMNTFTDEPNSELIPSTPPTLSGAIECEGPSHNKASERNKKEEAQRKESERKTATSFTKQRKSRYTVDREHADVPGSTKKSSSHQRVSKKVMPRAEQQEQKGSQESSSDRCISDYAPPPSPVHSALGQVVSEVLFPEADSSPVQSSPVSSVSRCTASAPPQSSVPPCDTQNSIEVISQLLQEAEDSDEKEFEDDPLLQVLRKQRTWVKEQISEVDSVLNELLDEQEVT